MDELRFAHALAAGTVKQNRVAVGFPDGGQLDGARSVQALRLAVRSGHRNAAAILTDVEFAAVRNRPDFADLVWDLADSPPLPR